MYITKKKDTAGKKILVHRIADYPGGVGIKTSLLGGDAIEEGTPIAKPNASTGLANICKFAVMQDDATNAATDYKVLKGHHFQVGDFVMSAAGAKAYAITAIDKTTSTAFDTITLGTTLGAAVAEGAYLYEAAAQSATTTSALMNTPIGVVGTYTPVKATEPANVDVWLMAVVSEPLPALYAKDTIVSLT